MIGMFQPTVSEAAIARARECLQSGWIGAGKATAEFETRFAHHFGLERAVAVTSGTAALHLAMLGAGIGPGDEVITTALTFAATAMSVLYVGAHPVFADLSPGTPNIDPTDVEKRVTPRTKAILPVHYGGYPCDMDELQQVASRHGLEVIEDAAHALGASYHGRPVGSFGSFGTFSFQAIKQLTTGDGGMLTCGSEDAYATATRRRWFGVDKCRRVASEEGELPISIREVGYKYHMNDITASLGLGQLDEFDEILRRCRLLNQRYRGHLGGISGLSLLEERDDRESACWLFTVRVERRLDFLRAVRSRGVEAAVWHRRIDASPLFGGIRDDLPELAQFDASQVSIPLRASLTEEESASVIEAVLRGW